MKSCKSDKVLGHATGCAQQDLPRRFVSVVSSPLDIELVGSATEHYGVEGMVENDREGEGDSRPVLQFESISLIDQCKSLLAS